MLKDENIICISSIDWDFLWQQHQAIMSALANSGNRILFIENTGVRAPGMRDLPRLKKRIVSWIKNTKGFRKVNENLYIYSPLIFPFPYFRLTRLINRFLLVKAMNRWIEIMDFYNPIIWSFLPTPIVLGLIKEIPHKLFVYYCTDNFAATSKSAKKIVTYEKKVIKKADVVFIMSANLFNLYRRYNKNVTRIPMGIDISVFGNYECNKDKPLEIKKTNGPIIGYIGGVRNSVDQELVKFLANKLSNFSFIFVGPLQEDISKLKGLKNIIFTGEKLHQELPNYIRFFDVCIIPYKKNEYTNNISPAKLNEYLAMGKPVVSTNLEEILRFNKENQDIVYLAHNYEAFCSLILEAMRQDSEILINRRKEIAKNNSWDKKIELMSGIINQTLEKKYKDRENQGWQERFIKIYRHIKRRTVSIIFLLILLRFVIFYSPLLWGWGSFLKISQIPQPADAIVVFAGGVGESGQPGQGYEERVEYAVKLYKKGYADKIIFSSGFKYAFKETELMKTLAVSLGVPGEKIIQEDNAKNTYENIKFSEEILKKNGWKKILLVSSPYHMRRVSLVFKKSAKDLTVVYTPIPKSLFYRREQLDSYGRRKWKQINIQQIKSLLHEYLGIIYYWFKGYI